MAESFDRPPSVQFATAQGRGFYGALTENEDLRTTFVLLTQARQAARTLTVPPPPADFVARVRAARSIQTTSVEDTGPGPALERLRWAGSGLAERVAAAVQRAARAWHPAFPNFSPNPTFAGATLSLDTVLATGERVLAEVDLSNGWHVITSADPTDGKSPDGDWTVLVGLTDPANADLPVPNVAVLLGLPGDPTPRSAITDEEGVAEFAGVPATAIPGLEWHVPAADEDAPTAVERTPDQ
jgi:hypothetical protein